jgi:hypothetical protein
MDVFVSELGNMTLSTIDAPPTPIDKKATKTNSKVSGKSKSVKNTENIHFVVEEIPESQITHENIVISVSELNENSENIENSQTSDRNKPNKKGKKESESTENPSPKIPKPPKEPKEKKVKEKKPPKEKKVKEKKPPKEKKPIKDKYGRRIRASFLIDTETKKPITPIELFSVTTAIPNIPNLNNSSPTIHHNTENISSHSHSHIKISNSIEGEKEKERVKEREKENKRIPSGLKTDIQNDIKEYNMNLEQEPLLKKRGRKPKGGKLILKNSTQHISPNMVANVILHLKCSLNDLNEYTNKINKIITDPLEYNPDIPPDISAYNENTLFSQYDGNICSVSKKEDSIQSRDATFLYGSIENMNIDTRTSTSVEDDDKNINLKEINSKLKQLKISLYKNQMHDKKSACFWCTYEYDNPTCYIPKYEMDGQIVVYGSFCKPECAVAYLMKENIDDSTKFERYHLLNQIYGKIFNYKKNIKPAPNPYYLLDKFYGNLTIQEYRKLSKTDYILMTIDKPLTRILPELYEETEDNNTFNGNHNGPNVSVAPSNVGVYKVKRQSEKVQGPSKSSIIRDKFGLA